MLAIIRLWAVCVSDEIGWFERPIVGGPLLTTGGLAVKGRDFPPEVRIVFVAARPLVSTADVANREWAMAAGERIENRNRPSAPPEN